MPAPLTLNSGAPGGAQAPDASELAAENARLREALRLCCAELLDASLALREWPRRHIERGRALRLARCYSNSAAQFRAY